MLRRRFPDSIHETRQPALALASGSAFMACPVAVQQWVGGAPWHNVYAMAFAEARAVVRPSILDRLNANLLN